ncbi:MAG: redoxin domain-containing protein, partial [Isosphaerales bacterium]
PRVSRTMLNDTNSRVPPTMTSSRIALISLVLTTSLSLTLSRAARGQAGFPDQDDPAGAKPKVLSPGGAGASLRSINEDYARQLLQLERQRLERLAQLASRQSPKEAAETYEQLFRLAIANNLFRDAEPAAKQVLKSTPGSPPVIQLLARTIDIIASADRGDYDESLAEFRTLIEATSKRRQPGEAPAALLDTSALLAICEAYYQRLIQGDQFDAARKAFQLLLKESDNPAVKGFSSSRLNQLDMIGKPAPAIEGTDLDGKPVSLADRKGNVVLVVFWASWCLPSSAEVDSLDQVYNTYRNRGFRVLGINLDTLQTDSPKLETVLPNIRRFLLDHNVRWPNLINGSGANDYAKAYGVSDIPSNVLIGRDGNVMHLDLSPRKNLESVVARAVAP